MILTLTRIYIFCTPIVIQMINIFCFDLNDYFQKLVKRKQIFGYDFAMPLELDFVMVWKISGNSEPFKPTLYNGEAIHFGPEETYLIFTQTSMLWYTAYYWLGRNTSLVDKQVAAKYAVLLHELDFGIIKISRETQGMESASFRITMAGNHRSVDFAIDYIHLQLPSLYPNLYMVLGEEHSRIKKIPLSLSLKWLKRKDICLVLEVEYKVNGMPVYYFCGSGANERQIDRSTSFANKFFNDNRKVWKRQSHPIETGEDFKQFIEFLENNKLYNPNEVDDSEDHLKNATDFVTDRDVEVTLFDVPSNGLNLNIRRPNRSSMFYQLNNIGHILDTKSVAGIFLVLPGSSDLNIEAIQLAEKYMDNTYPLSSGQIVKMRIVGKYPLTYIIDFQINLSDYPSLDRNQPEEELW